MRPGTILAHFGCVIFHASQTPEANHPAGPMTNAQAMPGSVGPLNRAATYTPGDARVAGPLSLQKKQMQMHNGYPVLDITGLPSGALAPQIP
jgi:hypothetical protein